MLAVTRAHARKPGSRHVRKQAGKSAGKPETQLTKVGDCEMVIKERNRVLSKRIVKRAAASLT